MSDQLKNTIAQLLTAIGGFLVGKGWITSDMLSQAIPLLVGVIGFSYSVYLNTKSVKVASVAALPEVKSMTVAPSLAAAVGDNSGTVKTS